MHIIYLFIYFLAAEGIISLGKKESYNLYSVLESNFLRENIELRLWHGSVCLIKLRHMLMSFATLAKRVRERRMLSHCGSLHVQKNSYKSLQLKPEIQHLGHPQHCLGIAYTTQNSPQLSAKIKQIK